MLSEGLLALLTFVGLLTGVDPLVLRKKGVKSESLAAFLALIRLLARVDAPVLREL